MLLYFDSHVPWPSASPFNTHTCSVWTPLSPSIPVLTHMWNAHLIQTETVSRIIWYDTGYYLNSYLCFTCVLYFCNALCALGRRAFQIQLTTRANRRGLLAWVHACIKCCHAPLSAMKLWSSIFPQPQSHSHVQWTPPHSLTLVGLKLLLVCMMYRGALNYWMRLLVSACVHKVGSAECVMSSVTWESCDHTGLANRLCSSSGEWEEPDVRNCQSVAFRNIETTVSRQRHTKTVSAWLCTSVYICVASYLEILHISR